MPSPKIIFQDNHILIVNKPSGLVVNRAESVKVKTLQDWVEEKFEIKKAEFKTHPDFNIFISRSGVVHRLDKDTSGVMVIAKTPQTFVFLQKQFKERKVIKKYLALVHGKVEPKVGDIKMPLARQLGDRKKFTVRLGGRRSITEYKALKYMEKDKRPFSLLEINLKTGRTHQIRVHFKHLGYPLVSDVIYLGKKRLKEDKKWCPRLFLHAQYLSFIHPKTGKRVEFKARLSPELNSVLKNK